MVATPLLLAFSLCSTCVACPSFLFYRYPSLFLSRTLSATTERYGLRKLRTLNHLSPCSRSGPYWAPRPYSVLILLFFRSRLYFFFSVFRFFVSLFQSPVTHMRAVLRNPAALLTGKFRNKLVLDLCLWLSSCISILFCFSAFLRRLLRVPPFFLQEMFGGEVLALQIVADRTMALCVFAFCVVCGTAQTLSLYFASGPPLHP